MPDVNELLDNAIKETENLNQGGYIDEQPIICYSGYEVEILHLI